MRMKACIFNIQKFSIHDGPGIRTVVFFKGCPLTCRWCSNPESQQTNIQVFSDISKCVQCGECIRKNKAHNIHMCDGRIVVDEYDEHEDYNALCPNHALQVEGRMQTIDQITKEVMKDKDFYEESNGGVTLSGGEVLTQASFAISLAKELHSHSIHVAAETTGFANIDIFSKFIENIDLLLYDMKHYDTIKHVEACGVSNDQIIRNMKFALLQGKDIIARIPVIPHFNDTLQDALNFSELLNEIGIKEVQLLPFHQFGLKKYELLGKDYKMKDVQQYHKEDLEEYKDIMIKEGLHCYI